jgi:hypothetical protein
MVTLHERSSANKIGTGAVRVESGSAQMALLTGVEIMSLRIRAKGVIVRSVASSVVQSWT